MGDVEKTAGAGLIITVFEDQRKLICAIADCSLMGLAKNSRDPA
jgi:hypothetical protein